MRTGDAGITTAGLTRGTIAICRTLHARATRADRSTTRAGIATGAAVAVVAIEIGTLATTTGRRRSTGTGDATAAAVVLVRLLVDAGPTTTILAGRAVSSGSAGTGAVDTCFPGGAHVATRPAVRRIALRVDAGAVAVGAGRETTATGPVTTSYAEGALVSACPAIARVGVRVDAVAAAVGGARWTDARPIAADHPRRALMAARPAVVGVGVQVDAGATAVGEARQASAAASITTGYTWWALISASPTVVLVGVQVDTGTIAVGRASWTDARPIFTDSPVTTERFSRSTRLPRPVVTCRGKGGLKAQVGEDPTEGAGQHAFEYLSARRAAGQQFRKLIKAGGVHDLLLVRMRDTLHLNALAKQLRCFWYSAILAARGHQRWRPSFLLTNLFLF